MFLIPLVLGALAMQLPFLAVVLLWLYLARVVGVSVQQPIKVLGAFFIVPLGIMLLDSSPDIVLSGFDAVLGVGIPSLVFVLSLARNSRTTTALAAASTSVIAYGTVRAVIFAELLQSIQAEAQAQLQNLMPSLMNRELYAETFQIFNVLMPGFWTAFQVIALLIGLIVFHRQLNLPFLWTKILFPWQYNLLFLAVMPLYAFPQLQGVYYSALVGLSVIPCIQGSSILTAYLSRVILNKVVRAILLIMILINSISLVFIALLGFADIWLNLRKIETEGSPA